jgi:hypothetical protein
VEDFGFAGCFWTVSEEDENHFAAQTWDVRLVKGGERSERVYLTREHLSATCEHERLN